MRKQVRHAAPGETNSENNDCDSSADVHIAPSKTISETCLSVLPRFAFMRLRPAPFRILLLLKPPKPEPNLFNLSGSKKNMRYLHTMLRVRNLDKALKFYQDALGLKEVRRVDNDKAKFTLVFLSADEDEGLVKQSRGRGAPLVELTYNWDEEKYGEDRYFGHLAYEVDDIYPTCDRLMKMAITINRPPRDGQMP